MKLSCNKASCKCLASVLSLWVFAGGFIEAGRAQEGVGEISVLHATGAGPLTTETRPLHVDFSLPSPIVQFSFGFATEETVMPGQFADSFTVTLQNETRAHTLVFLTADVSGVFWAPPTPGTTPIAPESILRTPVPFPGSIEPVLPLQLAYRVEAPIPADWAGQTLTLHFDLFDNMNGVGSLGWFSDVAVVPEPRLWFVAPFALLLLLRRRP